MIDCSNCDFKNVSNYAEPCRSCPNNIITQLDKEYQNQAEMPDGFYEEEGYIGGGFEWF